jgi:hypothetical protein
MRRDLKTFKASVLAHMSGHIIVHDRYVNYDSAEIGPFLHQLSCQHLLRDLDNAHPRRAPRPAMAARPAARTHLTAGHTTANADEYPPIDHHAVYSSKPPTR